MQAVVLESDVLGPATQTVYQDNLRSYQFPARYLRHFSPLQMEPEMLAIIYEPRGRPPKGRMAYVGWALLHGEPERDRAARGRYVVRFATALHCFQRGVPRELDGDPVERWLRAYPRGHLRNTATRGRAVRTLTSEEARLILQLGDPELGLGGEAERADQNEESRADRVRVLVERMERAAVFKDDVLKAYDFRCAVSGLVGGGVGGLVEAAHIRGAAKPHNGPDKVTNGIALTPSIHRAFDRNLFGFEYVGDELRVVTSSALRSAMVENSASGANLTIRSGQRALLPTDPVLRPERKYVDYQRSLVIG